MNTALLDPVVFDAIHLSALANDGIGRGAWFLGGCPHCIQGHALWLDGHDDYGKPSPTRDDLYGAGIGFIRNDESMAKAGIKGADVRRVPFEAWCEIVGVDVRG